MAILIRQSLLLERIRRQLALRATGRAPAPLQIALAVGEVLLVDAVGLQMLRQVGELIWKGAWQLSTARTGCPEVLYSEPADFDDPPALESMAFRT